MKKQLIFFITVIILSFTSSEDLTIKLLHKGGNVLSVFSSCKEREFVTRRLRGSVQELPETGCKYYLSFQNNSFIYLKYFDQSSDILQNSTSFIGTLYPNYILNTDETRFSIGNYILKTELSNYASVLPYGTNLNILSYKTLFTSDSEFIVNLDGEYLNVLYNSQIYEMKTDKNKYLVINIFF